MIDDALVFLQEQVNRHLKGIAASTDDAELVKFADTTKPDAVEFAKTAVSMTLLNVEQDRTFRRGDPYTAIREDGTTSKVQPAIALNLNILFVANFKDHEQSWHYISMIIQYFQRHPVFDVHNAPNMNPNLDRLAVELVSLPISEMNEIWGALRSSLKPSILYQVKVVSFVDADGDPSPPVITSIERDLLG